MNRPSPSGAETPGRVVHLLDTVRTGFDALRELLQGYQPLLLKIANDDLAPALRAKAGGASDLVNETLLQAQRGLFGFKGDTEAELRHWLCQILRHKIIDVVRKARPEVSLNADSSGGGLAEALAAEGESPSELAMAAERGQVPEQVKQALDNALEKLSDADRQIVLLRQRYQWAWEDVGYLLKCSADAARKRYMRALHELREDEQLQKLMEDSYER